MEKYQRDRTLKEAMYVIATKATIRRTAQEYGVSKSTVHKDLNVLLPQIDEEKFSKVRKILEENKSEWHIRGSNAIKQKYEKLKKKKDSTGKHCIPMIEKNGRFY